MSNSVVTTKTEKGFATQVFEKLTSVYDSLNVDATVTVSIGNNKKHPNKTVIVGSVIISNPAPQGDFTVDSDGVIRY